MKYIYSALFLIIFIIQACQTEKENPTEDITFENQTFQAFQDKFPSLEFSDTLKIHYWDWSNEKDSSFYGQKVENEWLAQFVDTSKFKINAGEEYYAVNRIDSINAYLIRIANKGYEYQQQIFALMINEKGEMTDRKKMASFFGAPGFTNTSVTWLVPSETKIEMIMRNNNWSADVNTGQEYTTDSIRIYHFENNTFVTQTTFATTKALEQQFKFK